MQVYEASDAAGNVIVLPQARGGTHRWPPGRTSRHHSHDGAIEVFLILEGCCDMTIGSETQRMQAGQYVLCPADVPHQLHNPGPDELLLFLLVAPHREPTHTYPDASTSET